MSQNPSSAVTYQDRRSTCQNRETHRDHVAAVQIHGSEAVQVLELKLNRDGHNSDYVILRMVQGHTQFYLLSVVVFFFAQMLYMFFSIRAIAAAHCPHPRLFSQVHDIEENIWIPQLGIKGKVDVTLKACFQVCPCSFGYFVDCKVQMNATRKERLLPLELKTGKSGHSSEHAAQVKLQFKQS